MDEHELTQPFFLIVIDEDRGVFSVEGPMTDGRPWQYAARKARKHQHRRIVAARPDQIVMHSRTRSPRPSMDPAYVEGAVALSAALVILAGCSLRRRSTADHARAGPARRQPQDVGLWQAAGQRTRETAAA
jgi:hypothetical protein